MKCNECEYCVCCYDSEPQCGLETCVYEMTDEDYIKMYNMYLEHRSDECKNEDVLNKLKCEMQAYNKKLIAEFPFLIPRNVYTGLVVEDYDYSYTELDEMPDGWRIAFGLDICRDIKEALLQAQEENPTGGYKECDITTNYDSDRILPYLEGYQISQIKEKFGSLRWYDNGAPKQVYKIISRYEKLSEQTCIHCGKPATKITTGWICPFCDDCATEDCIDIEEWDGI